MSDWDPDRDASLTDGVLVNRCIAWLIDICLIAILFLLLAILTAMLGAITLGLTGGLAVLFPFVPLLYQIVSLLRPSSATPGQRLLGLTVVRNDDLRPPTPVQVIVFAVVYELTMLTSGLLLIVALFTTRRRTLHDLLSGLVVVRADALKALTRSAPSWNMVPGSYPRQGRS